MNGEREDEGGIKLCFSKQIPMMTTPTNVHCYTLYPASLIIDNLCITDSFIQLISLYPFHLHKKNHLQLS